MNTKVALHLEEVKNQRVVNFYVNSDEPERDAWNLIREWVVKNVPDYAIRRYFGFAKQGHHPNGEDNDQHVYCAQMFLIGNEGTTDTEHGFENVEISKAQEGLYLVGDVVLEEKLEDGSIDIGSSMKITSQYMYEQMLATGIYELDMPERCFLEEHIFSKEWFEDEKELASFRFWLPIKRK